jgi:hypothetical protein
MVGYEQNFLAMWSENPQGKEAIAILALIRIRKNKAGKKLNEWCHHSSQRWPSSKLIKPLQNSQE